MRAAIDLLDGYFTGNETAGIDAVHQFVGTAPEMGTKVLETAERTTRCNTERQMTEKGFNIAVEAKSWKCFIKAFWDNRRNRYGTAHQRHRSHL